MLKVEHDKAVADFIATLELACRQSKNVELIEPEQILSGMPKPPSDQAHPFRWQITARVELKGQIQDMSFNLEPDQVFGLSTPNQRALFFLEIDLAVMPAMAANLSRSSFYKKVVGYTESGQQELYSKTFGFKSARVLTITTSAERMNRLIETVKVADPRGQNSEMFLFAQAQDFTLDNPSHVLTKAWQNARGQTVSLLD